MPAPKSNQAAVDKMVSEWNAWVVERRDAIAAAMAAAGIQGEISGETLASYDGWRTFRQRQVLRGQRAIRIAGSNLFHISQTATVRELANAAWAASEPHR